jgi:molecular chaperone DnaK
LIESRNAAEGQLHNLRKDLAEHGDKITAEEKTAIEDKIKDLEAAIAGDDDGKINEETGKLWEAMKPLLDKKMEAEQQKAKDQEDGVVDAEIKEVKEAA